MHGRRIGYPRAADRRPRANFVTEIRKDFYVESTSGIETDPRVLVAERPPGERIEAFEGALLRREEKGKVCLFAQIEGGARRFIGVHGELTDGLQGRSRQHRLGIEPNTTRPTRQHHGGRGEPLRVRDRAESSGGPLGCATFGAGNIARELREQHSYRSYGAMAPSDVFRPTLSNGPGEVGGEMDAERRGRRIREVIDRKSRRCPRHVRRKNSRTITWRQHR